MTRNNAYLTTQLSNSVKLNLDIDKKLKLNPTQHPEESKLLEKGNTKEAPKKNLDPEGYFWAHGFQVMKRHSNQTCSTQAAGHQRASTRKISWRTARPVNYIMIQIWDTIRW